MANLLAGVSVVPDWANLRRHRHDPGTAAPGRNVRRCVSQ